MNKQQQVQELVDAHARMPDEEMKTAVWIRRDKTAVCLVELLPGFGDDDRIEDPVVMSAGKNFRFDLELIAGNETSLREGIQRDSKLAQDIAAGEILFGAEEGRKLQDFAKKFAAADGPGRHG